MLSETRKEKLFEWSATAVVLTAIACVLFFFVIAGTQMVQEHVSYPVVLEKYDDIDGFHLQTEVGKIDVPYPVFQRTHKGDRVRLKSRPHVLWLPATLEYHPDE